MKERIGKYYNVISGYAFKSSDLKDSADIPIIKIGNISNGRNVIFENMQYVNLEFLTIDEKYHIEYGDVLISLTGSHINQPNSMVGRVCRNYDKQTYLLNQRAGKIFAKENASTDYIFYALLTKAMKESIVSRAYGAANQVNVSPSAIMSIKWDFPSLPIQQKIASILSAYDRLIENNTRRIRLLEQMTENLYKEWFVRFRFPGHEKVEMVKSKFGRIPSNFNIIKMQDAFDSYVGGGWGQEDMSEDFSEEASVIRGADFPKVWQYDISTCPRRFHKKSNYRSRQLEDGDIVMEISGGTSEQPVGRNILVTQSLIDRFDNGKVICASFCKLIRLKKDVISPFFFYYWMKSLYDTRIINRFQLQSTGIINFKFELFLRKGDIMLPPMSVMNSFESHVVPIHKEMNKLAQQNQLLTRQRYLLLPRLMSGKLEVKS